MHFGAAARLFLCPESKKPTPVVKGKISASLRASLVREMHRCANRYQEAIASMPVSVSKKPAQALKAESNKLWVPYPVVSVVVGMC